MVEKPYRKTIHTIQFVLASELFTSDVKIVLENYFIAKSETNLQEKEDVLVYLQIVLASGFFPAKVSLRYKLTLTLLEILQCAILLKTHFSSR